MADLPLLVTLASAGTVAIAVSAAAVLRAWKEWVELRKLEIETHRRSAHAWNASGDLADLRGRIRRLEAIADGAEG